jgi:hypothetical protein
MVENEQRSLFADVVIQPIMPKGSTIEERFNAFHQANPHVYAAIVRMAMRARARGIKKWSMNGIFEILRWKSAMVTNGEPYKLSNDFRALYSRMVMAREPELAEFFDTKKRRSE